MDPTFLVIGAARSGTTALCELIAQHPDAFVSEPKEPHYFAFQNQRPRFSGPGDEQLINAVAISQPAEYSSLFAETGGCTAIGEGSVSNLYYSVAAHRIQSQLPAVKLITILRDPVDRAYSAYLYLRRLGHEPERSFAAALDEERERISAGWHHLWHYQAMGFYHRQLKAYVDKVARSRILVCLHEELLAQPQETIQRVYDFLEVDPSFHPAAVRSANASGIPRSKLLQSLIMQDSQVKAALKVLTPATLRNRIRKSNLRKPDLDEDVHGRLGEVFREDVSRLQDFLGRDLSHWKPLQGTSP